MCIQLILLKRCFTDKMQFCHKKDIIKLFHNKVLNGIKHMFGTSIYDQRHLDLKELIFKQCFWSFLSCFHQDSDPNHVHSINILFIVDYDNHHFYHFRQSIWVS